MIDPELYLEYSDDELYEELHFFAQHKIKEPTLYCKHNKIIHMLQQDIFYAKEKELWNDPRIHNKIIKNRCKYLNKTEDELTTYDILSGFKKSAIWYGYSGFNPLLCRYFYDYVGEKYGITADEMISYDPCGGWGHRMLGSLNIHGYIYNDIDPHVVENVKLLYYWTGLKEFNDDEYGIYKVYNHDAREFIPEEDFNVMFTCPPYYNLEIYNNTPYNNIEEYYGLIDSLFDTFHKKETCKVFGMVIREDFLEDKHSDWTERIELKNQASQHLLNTKEHKKKEYLYIWVK